MSESLRELAIVEYGASPKEIRVENETPINIFGTGGLVGYSRIPLFEEPLIVVARKGTLDKPIFSENPCWVIDTAFAVIPKKDVDAKWLYYQLSNYDLKKLNEATGVPSINRDFLYRIKFKKLPLPTQRKIARILSTADAVIEKTQAAIAKYKAIKQGMLHDLFTRGINPATGKLRPTYKDAPHLYKQSKLGWIPKEWEVERIDKLAKITTGNKDTQDKEEHGVYPFFVRSQIIEKISSYSYDGEAILTSGDGVGVCKIYHYINGKFDFHQRVYMLYEFRETIAPKFLFYFFSDNFLPEVNKYSAKTTVDSVRMEMIAGMAIPLPSISEQNKIAQRLITIENKIQSERTYLHKLQQIKAGLMADLLSGKKKVNVDEEPVN